MPWVRLDDHFDEHPKLAAVGPLGLALWVAGIAYSNRNLTDGFIPRGAARSLLCWTFTDPGNDSEHEFAIALTTGSGGEDVTSERVISFLLAAGLWAVARGGYQIHDYEQYQPTKAQVEAEKRAKRDGGKKGAARRWGNEIEPKNGITHNITHGSTYSKTMGDLCPVPVPVPEPNGRGEDASCARARQSPYLECLDAFSEIVGFVASPPDPCQFCDVIDQHIETLGPDRIVGEAQAARDWAMTSPKSRYKAAREHGSVSPVSFWRKWLDRTARANSPSRIGPEWQTAKEPATRTEDADRVARRAKEIEANLREMGYE